MRKITIGVRGTGVYITHPPADPARLITPAQARRYAQLLLDAAESAVRASEFSHVCPTPGPCPTCDT